jgi:hypothetical protein
MSPFLPRRDGVRADFLGLFRRVDNALRVFFAIVFYLINPYGKQFPVHPD